MSRPVRNALVAAAVAAVLFLPSVRFGFAYDDSVVVEGHPHVTGHAWVDLLVSPYHAGTTARVATGLYRPLTILSLALNHVATGLHPWSYHLVNVLLHALLAALVCALGDAVGLSASAALIGALAFAVHPVHVEPIANVAGRAELLSSAFGVGALVLYLRDRRRGRVPGITVALLAAAACFSKENAVTLLGIVLLWEVVSRAPALAALKSVLVVLVPVAAYLAARLAVLGSLTLGPGAVTPVENPIVGLTGIPRAATVLATVGRAAALVVTPVRLAPDYGWADSVPSSTWLAPGPLAGVAVLLIGAVACAWLWRRLPALAFLLGSAALAYSIVSNVFVVVGTILGDRLLYFPSVFACLLAGAAIDRLPRRAAVASAVLVIALLAARAAVYLPKWRDDERLFAYAARVAPSSVRSIGSYGALLAQAGQLDAARPLLDRAVTLAPDFIPARLNRAAAEMVGGDLDAAEADARHVLALDPTDPVARAQLAAIAARR